MQGGKCCSAEKHITGLKPTDFHSNAGKIQSINGCLLKEIGGYNDNPSI